jgi:peptide/nickel transport system substrate-binding protein
MVVLALAGNTTGGEAPVQTLNVAQPFNPTELSPWTITSLATFDIWEHFIEPLTFLDRDGKLHGIVAESWQMNSPTDWTVKIRQGLRFHDSKFGEMTAEDVKYSLERALRPDEHIRPLLPKVVQESTVEVVDRHTIRWRLAAPGTGSLPSVMSFLHPTSKAYVDGEGKDTYRRRPMGTGPYRFVEWVTNQRIVAEVNPTYSGQRPAYGRIVWRIIPDQLTARNALLAGEVDVFQFVPPDAIPEIQANPKTRIVETKSARMLFMVINASEPPLNNKLIRQAMNYAVDKKAIVEQLYRGKAIALRAPMQEVIPELNTNLKGYPYDPERARELLQQANYRGEPIKISAPIGRYTLDKEMGDAVAGMLRKVGLKVEYRPQEWGTYAQPMLSGKSSGVNLIGMGNILMLPEFVFTLWLLPKGQGDVYAAGRPSHWEAEVNRVSLMTPGDPRRKPILDRLQAEALDWAPWIMLVNLVDVYALSDRVEWRPFPTEYRNFKDARPR